MVTAPAPYSDRWQPRAGSHLTPQLVASVIQRADLGQLDRLADLLDELRETDAHLQSVLGKREGQLAGAEWEIRPYLELSARKAKAEALGEPKEPGAPAKPARKSKAEQAAEYCTEILESLPGFSHAVGHLQSAVYHGRAALEIVWKREGKHYVPACLEPIHPRRLAFAARDWRLYLWDASSGEPGSPFNVFPGVPFDELNASAPKFITHLPRVRGGYPTREGLGRTLMWPAMFKRFAVRDAMALAEMAGRMGRVGKYATGKDPNKGIGQASPEDIDVLETALNDWSSSVALIVPDTADVEFIDPVTGNTIHMPLIDWANAEISKAVLGGTLTTDAGTKGARSLGETQQSEQLMLARSDSKSVAETLRRDLLTPMVRERFGDTCPVPMITFHVDPEESLNDSAERLVKLVGAGLQVSQTFVRNLYGIEAPRDGEDLMSNTAAATVDGEPGNDPKASKGTAGKGPAANDSEKKSDAA